MKQLVRFTLVGYLLFNLGQIEILSQESGNDDINKQTMHYLELGGGMNSFAVRDLETSPLTYKHWIPSVHLNYFFQKNKFLGIISEHFSYGHLVNRYYPVNDNYKTTSINNDIQLSVYRTGRIHAKIISYLGGDISGISNFRMNNKFNNASLNYDLILSFAPSVLFEFNSYCKAGWIHFGANSLPKLDRKFKIQYNLSIPLISAVLRPGYTAISDFVDGKNKTYQLKNTRFESLDQLLIIRNRINIYYILRNWNMLKLSYNFCYYNNYKDENPIKAVSSLLEFSVVFRFNNGD